MEGSRKGRGKNIVRKIFCIYQFSSVVQSCLTLCNLMDCSMPGLPILHCLLEFAQTRVHWASDAIQPSHPLSSLSPLPSIFPSIRVFSNESALHIRCIKRDKTQRNYFRLRELAMGSQKQWDLWIQANLSSNSCSSLATWLQKNHLNAESQFSHLWNGVIIPTVVGKAMAPKMSIS